MNEPIPPPQAAPWGWIAAGALLLTFLIVAAGRWWATYQKSKATSVQLTPAPPMTPPLPPVEQMEKPIEKVRQEAKDSSAKVTEEQQQKSSGLLADPNQLNDFLKQVGDDYRTGGN